MSPDDAHRLELLITEGFATVRGDINVMATRESHNSEKITELRVDVDELQARRFPLPVIGGLCGVVAVLLSVVQVIGKG